MSLSYRMCFTGKSLARKTVSMLPAPPRCSGCVVSKTCPPPAITLVQWFFVRQKFDLSRTAARFVLSEAKCLRFEERGRHRTCDRCASVYIICASFTAASLRVYSSSGMVSLSRLRVWRERCRRFHGKVSASERKLRRSSRTAWRGRGLVLSEVRRSLIKVHQPRTMFNDV